jgi:hypothetical protein
LGLARRSAPKASNCRATAWFLPTSACAAAIRPSRKGDIVPAGGTDYCEVLTRDTSNQNYDRYLLKMTILHYYRPVARSVVISALAFYAAHVAVSCPPGAPDGSLSMGAVITFVTFTVLITGNLDIDRKSQFRTTDWQLESSKWLNVPGRREGRLPTHFMVWRANNVFPDSQTPLRGSRSIARENNLIGIVA